MSKTSCIVIRKNFIPNTQIQLPEIQLPEIQLPVNNIISNIIETLIDKKILCILNKIHNVYPSKFTKEHIQIEFNIIKQKIKIINKTTNTIHTTNTTNTTITTTTTTTNTSHITTDTSHTTNTTDTTTTTNTTNIIVDTLLEDLQQLQLLPTPVSDLILQLPIIPQCNARIWGFIYNKITMKKITSLDKIYKEKNINKFKLKDFNNKYILGSRCMRNIYMLDMPDMPDMPHNIYCHQHTHHLTHGKYNDIPDAEMCAHFIKDGKYL